MNRRQSANAAAKARAVCGRPAGSGERSERSRAITGWGTRAARSCSTGKAAWSCRSWTSAGVRPAKGTRPVRAYQSVAPRRCPAFSDALPWVITEQASEHEHGEGDEASSCQRGGKPFVVAGQAAASSHPGKGALHHPAPGQKHKALLGFWQANHPQADALPSGDGPPPPRRYSRCPRRRPARFRRWRLARWRATLRHGARSLSLVAETCVASRWPSVSTARWTLAPFLFLWPSSPERGPLSMRPCTARSLRTAAVGCSGRFAIRRRIILRSWTMASNPPASSQRGGLLMDDLPGRQVVGQEPPGTACPDHVAQGVEDRPQGRGRPW